MSEVIEVKREKLKYERMLSKDLWQKLRNEEEAIEAVWEMKSGESGFLCSCDAHEYWTHKSRPEIRECKNCNKQHRVRSGTIFEHSKLPLLTWLRAIHFVVQDKRGISTLQLKRMLGLCSMATSWLMLMKIRKALVERDSQYKLSGTIELDGAYFVNDMKELKEKPYKTHSKGCVFVAIEQKKWVDSKGQEKMKAGFAKIMMDSFGHETRKGVESFVRQSIKPRSFIKTDGKFKHFPKVKTESKTISGDKEKMENHLPWVHKFISNAKRWVLGTHHGSISKKYLPFYLGEYTYRFNRRHDPNSLYNRALSACVLATPIRSPALTGNA